MNVVLVSSELSPYARTGGLADSVGSLARALARRGADVSILSIHYPREVRRAIESGALDVEHEGLQRGPKDVSVDVGAERIVGKVHLAHVGAGPGARPVRIYLVGCDRFFDREGVYGLPGGQYDDNPLRFGFFCRAALEVIRRYQIHPHVVHCHDWQTALVPVYSQQDYNGYFNTLLTIHDAGFQGRFSKDVLPEIGLAWDFYAMDGLEYWGDVSFLKGGILFASKVATVSPSYAVEIRTDPAAGQGLEGVLRARQDDVLGITCGIDHDEWNPRSDTRIAANFGTDDLGGKARCKDALQEIAGLPRRPDVPLMAMVTTLEERKGVGLLLQALPDLVACGAQIVLAETAVAPSSEALQHVRDQFPQQVAILARGDDRDTHDILAGADILLKPSRYEPCGRMQLRALRYGTIPVARWTGGLKDTVDDGEMGVGFAFEPYASDALVAAVRRAVEAFRDKAGWAARMKRAMARDHSWDRTAEAYLKVYGDIVAAA